MQAIITKYLGPTNHRGSRIKATAYAGSVTVPFDYSLDTVERHRAAAMALAAKYGWREGAWTYGEMPDGSGFAFVRAD